MAEEFESRLLDDAARAGWLYYVGGRTQDEIARTLGVSRQRAQRLVARAVSDGLIRVNIEHPIAELMELAARLRNKYELMRVRVAPDIGVDGNLRSVAPFAAKMLEEVLSTPTPRTIGFGTGRALRAMIDQMSKMSCPHHRLVSVIGNIAPDGTANIYEVLMRLTDFVEAPHYPLPTPVLADSPDEARVYKSLKAVEKVYQIADEMDAVFVGVGQFDETAPIVLDGFMSKSDWQEILARGVVGEICGRTYDSEGNYIETKFTERMMSYKIHALSDRLVVGIASGHRKVEPIRAALKGKLINALVTDESTARALLS